MHRLALLALLLVPALCCQTTLAQATKKQASQKRRAGLELFEKKIRPALIQHCYECHAADSEDLGGGLLLDSRAGWMAGGESGESIVPGKPADSLLIHSLEYKDLEMPPEEQLPPETIADFRRWIALGAPDPRKEKLPEEENGEEKKPVELWSLAPIANPEVPAVDDDGWPRTSADRFVLARLQAAGLQPNDDALWVTVLRRVYFDLIGLPPTPKQVADFLATPSEEQLAATVDELLASEHFGERWGRHWLDIARYGESAGSSRDVLMPYAWRYRDYVIDSLNNDIPFDRFISEQIAGDLLPAESESERQRLKIATGLLAIGSKSLNGGNLNNDLVDDQIDVISKSMLGLTVSCARCHDHKFDPIPTADYYALAGIFHSTDTRYGGSTKRPNNPKAKAAVYLTLGAELDPETAKAIEAAQKKVDQLSKQVAASRRRVATLAKNIPKEFVGSGDKPIPEGTDAKKAAAVRQYQGSYRILQKRMADLAEAKKGLGDEPDYALGVQDAKKVSDGKILIRGERNKFGDGVPRGYLTALGKFRDQIEPIDDRQSGRRQLAAWIVHPDNPLTARVAVNRIWQHLMGEGIVSTVDNFGVNGTEPTHPQLLDHLAHRLVHQHHWSVKTMIRELILSRAYRLSSAHSDSGYEVDPSNQLHWRANRRRLEAEPLRDAMLAVSGLLNSEPYEGSLVMQIGEGEVGRNINTAVLEKPFDYRSVYLPIIRGIVPEQLRLFDFPESSNVQGRRDSNTTPSQSLFLMNSDFVIRVSRHFAEDLLGDSSLTSDDQRITQAHLRCFAKPPSEAQIERAKKFLVAVSTAGGKKKGPPQDAWTAYCQTLIASAPFRYLD